MYVLFLVGARTDSKKKEKKTGHKPCRWRAIWWRGILWRSTIAKGEILCSLPAIKFIEFEPFLQTPKLWRPRQRQFGTPPQSTTLNPIARCLAQECAVSPTIAVGLASKDTSRLQNSIATILDSHSNISERRLPPLAAIALQDVNSFSLCSRQTAIKLIAHRVSGELKAADILLHQIFDSAANFDSTPCAAAANPDEVTSSQKFECDICFDEVAPQEAARLTNCSHECCASCLSEHVQSYLSTPGSNLNVPCFQSNCNKLMTKREVLSHCSVKAINVAVSRAIDDLVVSDRCLKRCDTLGCNYIYHFCPVRMQSSCTDCPDCKQKTDKKSVEQLLKDERDLQKVMGKLKIRRCGRCRSGVQKASGCNKMMCRCGYRFCYVCLSENAQCEHTPSSHGFINNVDGRATFVNLRQKISPDVHQNESMLTNSDRPRCTRNHHLELSNSSNKQECAVCHKRSSDNYSCIAGCDFHVCAECYLVNRRAMVRIWIDTIIFSLNASYHYKHHTVNYIDWYL